MLLSEIVMALSVAIIVGYVAVAALMVASLFMTWRSRRNGK